MKKESERTKYKVAEQLQKRREKECTRRKERKDKERNNKEKENKKIEGNFIYIIIKKRRKESENSPQKKVNRVRLRR